MWIEFAIFLSARTQRENGELRAVKKESGTEIGNSLEFDFVVPPPHS